MQNMLGIHSIKTEELASDIQHTKERKPDVLRKVVDRSNNAFILHIEFQSSNEPEMPHRMAEYYIMLLRKYRIDVRQYVIYIGNGTPKMKDHISTPCMHYRYHLMSLSSVDYQLFLRAPSPEEKMLAILGNFGLEDPEKVIEDITSQVMSSSPTEFIQKRHLKQLRTISKLRKFKLQNLFTMERILGGIELTDELKEALDDYLDFIEPYEKVVTNLLTRTKFTIAEIAEYVEVPESYVLEVKDKIAKEEARRLGKGSASTI